MRKEDLKQDPNLGTETDNDDDPEAEAEENAELEADQKNLWVQIDPYYYLTADSYNPVILVRFTKPNETRRADGELLNNKKWYFSNYHNAIREYAHQYVIDHGHELKSHDLQALKQVAKLVDDAFAKGLTAVQVFDDQYKADSSNKRFGQRVWHGQDQDDED